MLATAGCFNDFVPVNSDGETGDGKDPAPCWCATVEGAELDPPMGPNELIIDPDNNNASPKVCLGADPDVHAGLEAIDPDSAVVTATHDADLISFRDDVFAAAEAYCDQLADAQAAGSTNDCNSILVDGTDPLEQDEGRMCFLASEITPNDSWSDYYSLSNVISYNSGTQVYEIDEAFFADMLSNPWWLVEDSTYIARNANSDYTFANVQSGDVVYALGLRSNDVPVTINSFDVTSIVEVTSAYMELWTETEFDFVIVRPGVGTITLSYEVVP